MNSLSSIYLLIKQNHKFYSFYECQKLHDVLVAIRYDLKFPKEWIESSIHQPDHVINKKTETTKLEVMVDDFHA